MNIQLHSPLGGKYYDDVQLRLETIVAANSRFTKYFNQIRENSSEKIDAYTQVFIKDYGNDIEIISCLRDLVFSSRELLDYLLLSLNGATKEFGIQTNRNFLPFAKQLMNGGYDKIPLNIIPF